MSLRRSAQALRRLVAVENVDGDPAFGGRAHDSSQRLRNASAAANDFSQIFRIDDELDDRLRFFVDKQLDAHRFRFLHELAR